MPHAPSVEANRTDNGRLESFAWPGGYPIVYLAADGGVMCPDCANGENGSECGRADLDRECRDDRQWFLVGSECHWEGEPLECDHCGKMVESAYGPVDEE